MEEEIMVLEEKEEEEFGGLGLNMLFVDRRGQL